MNKLKGDVIKRYLLMHGANSNSFKLFNNKYSNIHVSIYQRYSILERRNIIDDIITKMNNFDGVCYVYSGLEDQKHLGDSVLIDYLTIYWNTTLKSKREKRLQKIKSKIFS